MTDKKTTPEKKMLGKMSFYERFEEYGWKPTTSLI